MSTALPTTGRSDTGAVVSGPRPGTYSTWIVTIDEPTVAATSHPGNGSIFQYVVAPFACRAMEASAVADDITVVGSLAFVVHNLTQSLDIVASTTHGADDTAVTVAAASLTNRNIAKGDLIRFAWVGTNAGDVVIRGSISLTVWIRGHVVASPDND